MNSNEVQNPLHKLDVYGSVQKSDYVFQKLSYSLYGPCLSLSSLNSSSDSKASLHFIAFSGSPTAVHRAFDVKAWPQSQTDFFTCTTVSFWTPRKRSHKHLSSTENPQYSMLQLTWSHIYCYIRVTERYTETLHVKEMAALVANSR